MKENLARHFNANPSIDLTDAAYTLQTGRKVFKYRWMAVCDNLEEAINALTSTGSTGNGTGKDRNKDSNMGLDMGSDRDSLTRTGRLWLDGQDMDWEELYSPHRSRRPHRVSLPYYPFERQRYWLDAHPLTNNIPKLLDILNKKETNSNPSNSSNLYIPLWKPSVIPVPGAAKKKRSLLLVDVYR